MLAIAFVLLRQAAFTNTITTTTDTTTTTTVVTPTDDNNSKQVTLPRSTIPSDSNIVSQKRNSAELISSDPLTKDVPSTVPNKPKPQLGKLRPITNAENQEISCSISPNSTSSAVGNTNIVNTCQNISVENFPLPQIPPASEQFVMQSEMSPDVPGNSQSNIK